MSLSREVRDPWGLVVAGVAGGLAWALAAPVGAAVAVGGAVYGVKVLAGALMNKDQPARPPWRKLPVRRSSPEEGWLGRAERAAQAFAGLASSIPPGPLAEQASEVGARAQEMLVAISRLAGQVSAVTMALHHVDDGTLNAERAALADSLRHMKDPQVSAEIERSIESLDAQLGVHNRLVQARDALFARLRSGALGMEGLVARLAEIVALSQASVTSTQATAQIGELSDTLEGLRAGITEAEVMSRRALSAFTTQDAVPDDVRTLVERRAAGASEGGS